MTRQARFVIPGHLYHVTQRGNYRQHVFKDDQDRICYLKLIDRYAKEYNNDLYAFCLMTNHVHFIIKPQQLNSLSQIFCRAHQQYSLYYHKKNEIHGHLWQERFYSCLLEGSHISAAIKYVECNPVRANLVKNAWDYLWSSTNFHLGKKYNIVHLADIRPYITTDNWKVFLNQKQSSKEIDSIRQATNKGQVFGSNEYIEYLEKKHARILTPQIMGRPKKSCLSRL